MARAREVADLECDESFARAAALVVGVRADEVLAHSTGVLDLDDIERLHDMRVATRRLRAALEVFRPCFPRKGYRTVLREVKAIADALGSRRDRDVAIDSLERISPAFGAAEQRGVAVLIERLRDEQRSANETIGPFVEESRLARLRVELRRLERAAMQLAGAGPESQR